MEKDFLLKTALKTKAPKDVVNAFLANTGKDDIENVANELVSNDAVYVSLNFENEELKKIEPWAGTNTGKDAYIYTFKNVGTYWHINNFQIDELFGENENVAVFGKFTYTSVELNNTFTSPFSILAKVKDGKITYFQFMEDTYASAQSFRKKGHWEIQNNNQQLLVGI